MSRSILLRPSVEMICGILNPEFGSVSANVRFTVRSSTHEGDADLGSQRSTDDRSTENGNVRLTFVSPTPSTAIAVP